MSDPKKDDRAASGNGSNRTVNVLAGGISIDDDIIHRPVLFVASPSHHFTFKAVFLHIHPSGEE